MDSRKLLDIPYYLVYYLSIPLNGFLYVPRVVAYYDAKILSIPLNGFQSRARSTGGMFTTG